MTQDSALISEVWSALKPMISSKDRLSAADLLVSIFDEYGMADSLENETGLDKELAAAVASYFELDDESEDDDWS